MKKKKKDLFLNIIHFQCKSSDNKIPGLDKWIIISSSVYNLLCFSFYDFKNFKNNFFFFLKKNGKTKGNNELDQCKVAEELKSDAKVMSCYIS